MDFDILLSMAVFDELVESAILAAYFLLFGTCRLIWGVGSFGFGADLNITPILSLNGAFLSNAMKAAMMAMENEVSQFQRRSRQQSYAG
jgi:hypothetical protein